MELQTVTITRTETFLVWANFVRPDLEVTQRDAEILLGYMAGHDYELVLQNGELFRHDVAEQPGEMQEYDMDDVIDIVCEWNYELKTDARHGMENPKDFIDFCNYKDAYDTLSADCENLDRLFARTKYGRANEKLVEQIVAKEMGVDSIKETIQKMADSESMEEPEKGETVRKLKWCKNFSHWRCKIGANCQCNSHFTTENSSKNGIESHRSLVFGQSGGGGDNGKGSSKTLPSDLGRCKDICG